MYIDPWQWFRDFQWQAIMDGNTRHLQLPQVYHRGWRYLEAAQYTEAISVFNEGADLARAMEIPIWEFFFESWVCEVHVLACRYTEALALTTRLVSKSVKPEYEDHPCRPVVYFTLAWTYFYIDSIGYEAAIIEALDALTGGMPLDEETHHRSIFLRAEIAYEKDQFAQALTTTAQYMNLVDGNPFRQASGYGIQRSVAFAKGDLTAAMTANHLREAASREASLLNNAVDAVLWQAVFLLYEGDIERAAATRQRGIAEYEARHLTKQGMYYHILAEYATVADDYDAAMRYRDQQLAQVVESGSLSNEFYCRMDRCYLCNRMAQDVSVELAAAEATAQRSKRPAFLLEKLVPIRAGRTARYDWQLKEH